MTLTVNDLEVFYGTRRVLLPLSFSIEGQGITAIVGPSGCGKSSLLWCLAGLSSSVDELRYSGEITWGLSPRANRRPRVGMIFQKPNPFPVSIFKNLEVPLKQHYRLTRGQRRQRVSEILDKVGLWDQLKHRLGESALQLSGGEQQRLCLARSLILEPAAMLLDEPCSALDPLATREIENLLVELKTEMTIVIVTHNIPQALRISGRLMVLWNEGREGYLVESGETQKLSSLPRNCITGSYLSGAMG